MNKDIRNEIIKYFEIQLKSNGFQKKGNTLTRETEKGLIQVIDFVLGQNYSITYNHLGLGFGIYTDEWFKHLSFGPKPKQITGTHCILRSDFNKFIPHDNNFEWIDLNKDSQLVKENVQFIIETYYLPQLENLTTRINIIEQWKMHKDDIGVTKIAIAILYWYLGMREIATDLFEDLLNEYQNTPKYQLLMRNTMK